MMNSVKSIYQKEKMPTASVLGAGYLANNSKIRINERIFNLIEDFHNLKDNWDEDDALAPTPAVLGEAANLVRTIGAYGQKVYHTAPGAAGEIMLSLRNEPYTRSLEIIIYPQKTKVVFVQEEGLPTQELFQNANLKTYITWLNEKRR